MSDVRHIKVLEDDDGQRLSRWLKKYVPEIPYGLAQKLMRKGAIKVDGKKVKPETRLVAGQEIRIPPVEVRETKKEDKKFSKEDAEFIKSLVIYQDEHVIAINKPPGLAVQGGSKMKRHVDGMLDAFIGRSGVRPRLVHRLDKDTSGVLLLARSAQAARKLGDVFKKQRAKKIYWALVTPTPDPHDGAVKAPLLKSGGPNKEKVVVDDKEGKYALTEYRVVEHAMDKVAFVAFWPRTGRTHQIRVHAEVMACPILGDGKYGGSDAKIEGAEHAKALHLHAQRIICPHPGRKGFLDISAPLPKELAESWRIFGFDPTYKDDPFSDMEF